MHAGLQCWDICSEQDSPILVKDFGIVDDCAVTSITISNDNQTLFGGNEHGWFWAYSVVSQERVKDFGKIFNNEILRILITFDNNHIICGCGKTGQLKIFDNPSWNLQKETVSNSQLTAIAISKDSQAIYTLERVSDTYSANSDVLRVRNIDKMQKSFGAGELTTANAYNGFTFKLDSSTSRMILIANTYDGKYLYISDSKGNILVYSIADKRIIRVFRKAHGSKITAIACSYNSKL